jgi:hypothetical protein
LSPPSRYGADIATLQDLSALNRVTLAADAVLPIAGGVYIQRDVESQLLTNAGDQNLLIVGDAGSGKSSIAQDFAVRRAASQEVVVLRAADLVGPDRVMLSAPATTIFAAWAGPPALLVMDGVDSLRGVDDRNVVSRMVAALQGSRWQVVATVRTFDARNNVELQQRFPGAPVATDAEYIDSQLTKVRHLRVGELTDAELSGSVQPPLALATLLGEASPDLRALLRNPFNLSLAARMAEHLTDSEHSQLLAVRSRVQLLDRYWAWRILHDQPTARIALLSRLTSEMAATRSMRVVEAEPVVNSGDDAAVQAMLSASVLTADPGIVPGGRRILSYSHNILFDYAAAIYLLLDQLNPRNLLIALDADPALPLVARPSFELLADLLWNQPDRSAFWSLCLDGAGSSHLLASLAFAARLLNLARDPDDLTPLASAQGRTDPPTGMLPAQRLVSQVVGALRGNAVLADATPAMAPLSRLAAQLAANARSSCIDAALAADLLITLERQAPLAGAEPVSDERAAATADLFDVCRSDPRHFEQLAGGVARLLPSAIQFSVEARAAVERLIDDRSALEQWGGTVLDSLAGCIVPAVQEDPAFARRVAKAVLEFRETRDEQVPFVPGALLPLTESRKQQADRSVDTVARAFPELCAADLEFAAEIYCYFANLGLLASSVDTSWPLATNGAGAHLQYGFARPVTRHDVELAPALSAALTTAAPDKARRAVDILIGGLQNAAGWADLMTDPSDEQALAQVLFPAFRSGALLAHPHTHPLAASLLAALARTGVLPATELEAAVQQAHHLIDAHDGPAQTKDVLLGCLNPASITSADLADRLDQLGPAGPPPIPPPLPKPTITATPWSLVDDVLRQGAEIEAPVEQAARRLISETTAANNTADNRPETERQLPDAFQAAVDAFADAALPQELQDALLDAAATLAEDDRVSPDTPLGNEVLARLMAAAIDASAGSLHNAQMMSWSSGRRDTAVKGLAAMLRGPAWRNSPARPAIIDKLTAALSDENAVVRWHAAGVAHLLGADRSPEQRCQAISQLLVHEDMPATRAVLVQQLFYDVGADPDAVDAVVKQLVEHEPQAVAHPDRDLGHVIIELMVHLAVVRHTDFASETVDGWCRNSPAHRNEAKAVAGLLRDYLADADNRRDAFQLLSHAADAAAADWSALLQQTQPGGQPTDEQRARTTAAAEIAHEVAQSIYFASGAFEHGNNAPLADLDAFADSAFPVLARCATVSVAQVVHPCVETMVFLASPDEPRALDAIATAVPRDSQYAGDSLAGGVVIPYLRRLLTEQRHLVLYTDNGAAAFRRLLEIFAGAGNEDALALAYTFAEVFR